MFDPATCPVSYWRWMFKAIGCIPAKRHFPSLHSVTPYRTATHPRPLWCGWVTGRHYPKITAVKRETKLQIVLDLHSGQWQLPGVAGKDFFAFEHLEPYLQKISAEILPEAV